MSRVLVQKQVHGYRQGHQLLSGSVVLADRDQDTVDRLSDLAGPLRPGELFDPYLTAYPLPSEEYYVVARTFQDLAAGRSGCVRTSSVLVPMARWDEMESLDGVLAELVCPDPHGVAVEREVSTERMHALERVADGRMPELIDAVFLDRRPVVLFDCAESEAIAIRLLLALWPAARRQFSVCTFALGPRSLEKRFFDLVFAPMSARSRFVGSGHQRVGGSERLRSGREERASRWAEPAALRIFESADPSLAGMDQLGLLRAEEGGERASLRVVSLWNELASRASRNPTAVLGMLDILRSRRDRHQDAPWRDLEAMVLKAIGAAADGLPVEEAWEFLFVLEAKLESGWTSPIVEERIEAGARKLAGRDTRQALTALAEDPLRRLARMRVVKGLAEGAAESLEFKDLVQEVERLPSFAVAQLMASSPRFVRGVVEGMNADQGHWIDVFLNAFEAAEEVAKRDIRRQTLTVVEGPVLEQTVPSLLDGATGAELAELVVQVIDRRELVSTALNRALWEAACKTGDEAIVRDAVMESSEGAEADQFVLQTLALNKPGVEWLTRRTGQKQRANRLLRALLADVGSEEIKALPPRAAKDVLALLGTEAEACKLEIARVLAQDVIRDEEAVDLGFRTLSALRCEVARIELGGWVLRAGLSDARHDDERVSGVLAEFGSRLAALDLVEAATSSKASARRAGANLVALDACPPDVRNKALREVERLTEDLVGRPQEDLGREGYTAWASIIRDSLRETGTDVRHRVAGSVLRFTLRLTEMAVSALIVESFPIVYESLPKAGKYRKRDGLGALFPPYYAWWLGLDEWEDKRKRAIEQLVRAFMNSTWPAADLMVTALKAGVEQKVVRQIREQDRGMRYIDDIRHDTHRLRKSTRSRVLKCLEVGR